MESVDRLREWAGHFTGPYRSHERQLNEIADAIEAEVAEGYVPRPTGTGAVRLEAGVIMSPYQACAADGHPVSIKTKLDEGAYLPERAHDTDAGADVRTPVEFTVPARGNALIATGVHVQTPHGYATMIKSKSGLNTRYDITSVGVIDEGFTGEVIVKLYNHGDHAKHFNKGDKITQLVVVPVCYPTYVQADEIEGGERGDAGYGSTGR